MNDLQCLLDEGLIDQETFDRLTKFARFTSNSQASLLQILAATALAGIGSTAPEITDGPVIGVQDLTSTTGSGALALDPPDGAVAAVVTVSGHDANVRFDGEFPTASIGHLFRVGDNNLIRNLDGFRFITTDTSSTIFVSYY